MKLEFLGNKERPLDKPYAVFEDTAHNWTWRVLKSWQRADDGKEYGRWFCAVASPYTGLSYEMGDTYVYDVVSNAQLVEVDGRPPTAEELADVQTLRETLVEPLF